VQKFSAVGLNADYVVGMSCGVIVAVPLAYKLGLVLVRAGVAFLGSFG